MSCQSPCENKLGRYSLSAWPLHKRFYPPCMGSAASTSLPLFMKAKHGKQIVENVHPSVGDIHCSVPTQDPKYNTCNSKTLEQTDVLEHHIQLFFGIQEVSDTRPYHSLVFRIKWGRNDVCSDVAEEGLTMIGIFGTTLWIARTRPSEGVVPPPTPKFPHTSSLSAPAPTALEQECGRRQKYTLASY